MKSMHAYLVAAVVAVASLTGCGSEDETPVAPKSAKARSEAPADPRKDPAGAVPVTVSANALTLGASLGPTGEAVRGNGQFTLDDTVHVSFPSRGRPAGAPVTVYWTYQDGRTHRIERATLPAGEFAHYTFSKATGMKPGNYNVEVQVANRPIGISDFVVR